jgi:hypothetical protein
MRANITNQNIDAFVSTLTAKDSFLVTTKIPHAIRQVIRINLKTLYDRLEIYSDGRREFLQKCIEDGWATADDAGNIKVDEKYIHEVNKNLYELSQVDNELEIATVDKNVLEEYLKKNDLTLAEEDVLLFFSK